MHHVCFGRTTSSELAAAKCRHSADRRSLGRGLRVDLLPAPEGAAGVLVEYAEPVD
jgi:hypothetical protein